MIHPDTRDDDRLLLSEPLAIPCHPMHLGQGTCPPGIPSEGPLLLQGRQGKPVPQTRRHVTALSQVGRAMTGKEEKQETFKKHKASPSPTC